ncbi:hypothetical protein PS1_040782 [Malus domestica]
MYCFRMSLLWFAWTSTREFGIEKLREATDGFRENSLIEGSLYKGFINGDVFAIQKMKWNAEAERVKPSDVILGTRGRGFILSVLQGSVSEYCICNYKSALVVIVPGNVRYTGGNWWTSEGKRGGNSLIHSSLSQKLWFIYRQLTDWMMEPYEQNLIHLIIKGLHKAICSSMLEEPSSKHMLRVTKVALWVTRLQRYYGNLMHTITVGLSHSLTHLFLDC